LVIPQMIRNLRVQLARSKKAIYKYTNQITKLSMFDRLFENAYNASTCYI
jgi:hypothetical protein